MCRALKKQQLTRKKRRYAVAKLRQKESKILDLSIGTALDFELKYWVQYQAV